MIANLVSRQYYGEATNAPVPPDTTPRGKIPCREAHLTGTTVASRGSQELE